MGLIEMLMLMRRAGTKKWVPDLMISRENYLAIRVRSSLSSLSRSISGMDGLIDSRNHNWLYYKGIKQSDWPVLAKRIVKSLEADEEISEPMVLGHFDLRAREYSIGPIKRLFERFWR